MTLVTNADDFPEFAHLQAKAVKCSCSHDNEEKSEFPEEEEEDEFLKFSHEELADCLLNKSGKVPLPARFRALFALKYLGDEQAINIIGQGNITKYF
jgi:hypothetical protein